jgi:hypothetical protein
MDLNLPPSARVRGQSRPSATNAARYRNPPALMTGYPLIEDPNGPNGHIQAAYEELRRSGESHSIAEMLAYRQAPASKTTDDFLRGIGTLDKQLGDNNNFYLNKVVQQYTKEMGHPPNPNYVYSPGLARYTGDPRAFVANEADVKRRAEELNVNVEGFVNHKAREPEEDPFGKMGNKFTKRVPIANDLKQMIREKIVAKNPDMKDKVHEIDLDAIHGNHAKSN